MLQPAKPILFCGGDECVRNVISVGTYRKKLSGKGDSKIEPDYHTDSTNNV
jgi:hypothetical protein